MAKKVSKYIEKVRIPNSTVKSILSPINTRYPHSDTTKSLVLNMSSLYPIKSRENPTKSSFLPILPIQPQII